MEEVARGTTTGVAEKRGKLAMFSALRHPNFRLLMFGLVFSLTGMQIRQVAQGWLVYEMTNDAFLLGLVGAAMSLPILFLSPLGGVASDRLDRRKLLVVSQSFSLSLMFILGTLVLTGLIEVWHVFIIALGLGTVTSFYGPARQAIIPNLVSKDALMNAIALNSATLQFTRIIGPAVAGFLAVIIGLAGCFYFSSATYAVIIAALFLIRADTAPTADKKGSVWANLLDGFKYLRTNRTMFALIAMEAVPAVFGWPYQMLMPIFARDILAVGPSGLGFLMSAVGIGSLIGALSLASMGNFRYKGALMMGAAIGFGVMLIFFALSPWFYLSLAFLVIVGVMSTMYTAMTNTLVQLLVPDEFRGRIMSLYMLAFAGMQPLGSLQAGTIANIFGAPVAVVIGGALVILFSSAVTIFVPKLRQL